MGYLRPEILHHLHEMQELGVLQSLVIRRRPGTTFTGSRQQRSPPLATKCNVRSSESHPAPRDTTTLQVLEVRMGIRTSSSGPYKRLEHTQHVRARDRPKSALERNTLDALFAQARPKPTRFGRSPVPNAVRLLHQELAKTASQLEPEEKFEPRAKLLHRQGF